LTRFGKSLRHTSPLPPPSHVKVTIIGTVRMCKAFLPHLRQTHGRIVNVSSVNGRMAEKFNSTTSAMKFALEGLSDATRMELQALGVAVVVVEPILVDTPLWRDKFVAEFEKIRTFPPPLRELYYPNEGEIIAKALRQQERFLTPPTSAIDAVTRFLRGDFWAIPPAVAAEEIFDAITAAAPKERYVVGALAKFVMAMMAILPSKVFEKLFCERANDPQARL
jgi:NAD(P)-dependent dehydrogenase (short-subunit alcohol dehydrogenase family)